MVVGPLDSDGVNEKLNEFFVAACTIEDVRPDLLGEELVEYK